MDELVAGADPNLPPDDAIGLESYGCVGRSAPRSGETGLVAAVAWIGVVWGVRLRRR